jgi:hypothetical protein
MGQPVLCDIFCGLRWLILCFVDHVSILFLFFLKQILIALDQSFLTQKTYDERVPNNRLIQNFPTWRFYHRLYIHLFAVTLVGRQHFFWSIRTSAFSILEHDNSFQWGSINPHITLVCTSLFFCF